MKECNCGRISPCYSGKKFRIHEELEKIKAWNETHDMVYELNKQMCDLGKTMNDPMKPLSDEAIQEIAKALEITRNPKDIMEEKKTKKMTKAEAFEYFKRKKILAEGEDANIGVQEKLFKCGIEWVNGGSVPFYHSNYLIVGENGRLYHCGCDNRYWFAHFYESIDADDILSIEIIEDKNNEFIDCSEPCPEIKAVQELLRNSNHLKDKIIVITKDNAAVL